VDEWRQHSEACLREAAADVVPLYAGADELPGRRRSTPRGCHRRDYGDGGGPEVPAGAPRL